MGSLFSIRNFVGSLFAVRNVESLYGRKRVDRVVVIPDPDSKMIGMVFVTGNEESGLVGKFEAV